MGDSVSVRQLGRRGRLLLRLQFVDRVWFEYVRGRMTFLLSKVAMTI